VEYLLAAGGNPNQSADDGASALHFAAQYVVRIPVLRALLRAGCDVNARKANGATPLFCAVENGATAAFDRILLDAGADPNLELLNPRTGDYDTPLSVARRKCSADVVGLLEEDGQSRQTNGHRRVLDTTNFSDKVEKARLLFRYAVTSNSTLTVSDTQLVAEDDDRGRIHVREGDRVVLVHGSLEEGLYPPYEDFVLASSADGAIGKVPRKCLYDAAQIPMSLDGK